MSWERFFDAALRLYPQEFRSKFGDDMSELFRSQSEQAARRGRLSLVWFASSTTASVVMAALYERFTARKPSSASKNRSGPMTAYGQDLRYGARALVKNPGFALIAALTLALGIGVNTTIFSLVNSLLFSELPITEPESFALIEAVSDKSHETASPGTLADYAVFKRESRVFEDVAVAARESFVLTSDDEPIRLNALRVSDNFFDARGVGTILGRGFIEGEDRPAASPVVVLSHGFWSRRFGKNPAVVGETLRLDGENFEIIGVQSPRMEFGYLADIDAWVPLRLDPETAPRERTASLSARVKAGASFDEAREETTALATRLAEAYPDTHRGWSLRVKTVSEALLDDEDRALVAVLFVLVGLVLLIACANVASMVLARATTRSKEVAVRVAMGAGRLRLVRQLLTESFLLSALAAALGLLLARGLLDLLVLITSAKQVLFRMADIDGQVLAFTLTISALTPLLFALAPAIRASRPDLVGTLKEGARSGSTRSALGSRGLLVMAQVGMAMMLMIVIALLVRELVELRRVELGFDQQAVVTARTDLPETKYDGVEAQRQFFEELVERVGRTPGIVDAAVISERPLTGFGARRTLWIEGAGQNDEAAPTAHFFTCSPAYFSVMGIPLVQGRRFEPSDSSDAVRVAIVSQTAAERFWPEGDAVGSRIRWDSSSEWTRIVGIVGDVINPDVNNLHAPQIYFPAAQAPSPKMALVARVEGAPEAYAQALRQHVWQLDAEQPVDDVRTLAEIHYDVFAENYALVALFAIFAAFAMVMASMGIYGVMSYAVSERRREISVRMALGAGTRDVLRLVVGQGTKLVLIGSAFGFLGALLANRMLSSVLFGVDNLDVPSLVGVPLALLAVALTANYLPARRAAHIDPMLSLRAD